MRLDWHFVDCEGTLMSQEPKSPTKAQPHFQEIIGNRQPAQDSSHSTPPQAQPRFQETVPSPKAAKGASASPVPEQQRFQETVYHARPSRSASGVPPASIDATGAVSFSEFAGQRVSSPKPRDYVPPTPQYNSPGVARATTTASDSVTPAASPASGSPPNSGQDNRHTSVAPTAIHTPENSSPFIRLLRSISPIIWAIVIAIVLIPLAGRFVIAKSFLSPAPSIAPHQELTIAPPSNLNQLDQDVIVAIQTARKQTRAYAAAELNTWVKELEPRVDSFLDWYFNYFTQKKLEVTAPLVWLRAAGSRFIGLSHTKPGESVNAQLTKTFQKEFTRRVLVPQTAQLRLEVLTTAAAEKFVTDLSQRMNAVQGKYRIPQGQWERYLDTIATTISDTEGNLSNLSLKALVGGTGYLAAKPFLLATLGKVGSKISTKFTATATAKLAAKTGTSVAAELGTTLIDPIVGVGILIWDVWDYQHTVAVDRPLLRSNIDGYLQSMQQSLLDNPETGVMAAINQLEASVAKSLQNR